MPKGRKTNLTIEFIKEEFNKRNYILLEDKYINNYTKMKYKCLKHPNEELSMAYSNFQQGQKCPHCALEIRSDKRRFTIEFVSKEFEKRGYILLEAKYKDSKQKLRYKCPKHPDKELFINWSNFSKGKGCIYCGGKVKLKHEDVKKEFEERNYILVSTYKNAKTKLNYRCPLHPEKQQSILLTNLRRGEGCLYCGKEKFGENQRGENNPSWKGGTSRINLFLRNNINDWKLKSLEKYDYRCFITNEKLEVLDVHHTVSFTKLKKELFKKLNLPIHKTMEDYTQDQIELLIITFKQLHQDIEGIPIETNLHKLFHSKYGRENFTYEDLLEFKQNYLNGLYIINQS